jgi:predicted metal-dependent enzyme (double-stranded beta helix superfamily)
MFDLDRFKVDCSAAVGETAAVQAVREIVARAVADPGAVQKVIGEPRRAEVQILHRSADLTILNVVWGPRMTVMPHNHEMWAVIGIYSGREDNILWRRLPGAARNRIEAAGAKALSAREAFPLGHDIIHSVTNPIGRLTGAIMSPFRKSLLLPPIAAFKPCVALWATVFSPMPFWIGSLRFWIFQPKC